MSTTRTKAAVVALATTLTTLTSVTTANAAPTYRVNTAGAPLTIRSAPSVNATPVGHLRDGSSTGITCQTRGDTVTGTYGRSNIWNQIAPGRYVADVYVFTGHDGQFLPTCTTSGARPRDDYPYRGATTGVDPWNFYKGQCTSFVAWRLNNRFNIDFHNRYRGQHFGNANLWDNAARAAGLTVNNRPTVGAVAQWNRGRYGHVAWVTGINTNGTITLEEYNLGGTERYNTRTIPANAVENYIHIH